MCDASNIKLALSISQTCEISVRNVLAILSTMQWYACIELSFLIRGYVTMMWKQFNKMKMKMKMKNEIRVFLGKKKTKKGEDTKIEKNVIPSAFSNLCEIGACACACVVCIVYAQGVKY